MACYPRPLADQHAATVLPIIRRYGERARLRCRDCRRPERARDHYAPWGTVVRVVGENVMARASPGHGKQPASGAETTNNSIPQALTSYDRSRCNRQATSRFSQKAH